MRYSRRGISIIETTIALLILATIGGALLALNVQIQSVANSSKFKSIAEGYALRNLEQARSTKLNNVYGTVVGPGCFVDGKFNEDIENPCVPCTNGSANSFGGTGISQSDPGFRGYLLASNVSGGLRLQSVVLWQEKGEVKCTEFDTYLYDY